MATARVLILLLFSLTVISVVSAKKKKPEKAWKNIQFPANVLLPDLEAVSNYYKKGDKTLTAYIHWPNAVTFRVEWLDNGYLKLDGDFQHMRFMVVTETHHGLYYKNNQFFVKPKDSDDMKRFSSGTTVYYKQPNIALKTKPYVSIRWFTLQEMQQKAESTYTMNKSHFQKVLDNYPAVFMTSLLGTDGQFLEYAYKVADKRPLGDEMIVRVLVGKKKNNLKVQKSRIGTQLVYDQKKRRLGVASGYGLAWKPMKHVIAVRMMHSAVLAEVREDYKRLYSDKDLAYAPELKRHPYISKDDLLHKAKRVEPRLKYYGMESYTPKVWPTGIGFQVKGITFVKNANIVDGKISESCPIIIEDEEGGHFTFEDKPGVKRLCTDEYKVWEP